MILCSITLLDGNQTQVGGLTEIAEISLTEDNRQLLKFSSKIKTSEQPCITLKHCVGYLREEVSAACSKLVCIELNEKITENENKNVEGSGGTEMEMI